MFDQAGGGGRVLLLADDPVLSRSITGLLRAAGGTRIDHAQTPAEALRLLPFVDYDVVVADLYLGGADDGGAVAIGLLHDAHPRCRYIVIAPGSYAAPTWCTVVGGDDLRLLTLILESL